MQNTYTKKRDATDTMNGFYYQRLVSLHILLLNHHDFEFILEEGLEDCDMIRINGHREITQIKYHQHGDRESLTISSKGEKSGLYKVIEANMEHETVDLIKFVSFNNSLTPYTNIKNLFDDKEYEIIGKLFLILLYNNKKQKTKFVKKSSGKSEIIMNKKISINVSSSKIDIINEYFKHFDSISKSIDSHIFEIFNDANKSKMYLSKIKLETGLSYQELNREIECLIKKHWPIFFLSNQSDDRIKIKCNIIKYHLLEKFEWSMFANSHDADKRKIYVDDLITSVDDKIKIFLNKEDILSEYLDSIKLQMSQLTHNDNDILYHELIDNFDDISHIRDTKNQRLLINAMLESIQYKPLSVTNFRLESTVCALIQKNILNKAPSDLMMRDMANHIAYIMKNTKKWSHGHVSNNRQYLDLIWNGKDQ